MTAPIELRGDVDPQVLALFLEQLASLPASSVPTDVDLDDAEFLSAAVVARLAEALRREARRIGHLRVRSAPQVLAHTLYRIGALSSPHLELVDPREELGTSS